jgi:nucleoside-diphosphate-sugar epimerase
MHTALIAGAGGAASKRLIEVLIAANWRVVALARTPRASADRLTWVAADLSDAAACRRALAPHRDVTHVFYTSRAKHGESGVESVPENLAMLRNVLDVIEPAADNLAHVHIVEGTKWYGMHLGPFPTPAKEDDDIAHLPPNFYYAQQDLVAERQRGKRWTWSASRPNFICDFAPERARNAITVIGAYAAIVRELGLALDFPGAPAAFEALRDITDATLLARAIAFMATAPACANAAFNVNNGDFFRWSRLWPKIAAQFGIAPGIVRPLKLATWIADKQPVWDAIVRRHGLVASKLDDVADWAFADFLWSHGYDIASSTTRLRQAGFHDILDTEDMVLTQLSRYREAKILP